jgi:hypothetical protein
MKGLFLTRYEEKLRLEIEISKFEGINQEQGKRGLQMGQENVIIMMLQV